MKGLPAIAGMLIALFAGLITAPIVAAAAIAIWLQDRRSPFYLPERVGLDGKLFRLAKLRSMVINADKSKVDTTIAGDPRVTPVGRVIRRFKLDELPQFWNVVIGDMAIVGPRPNVPRETDLYTADELRMLDFKPGITDFASIIFSDLGEILAGADDPNIAYNQLVRPWKSRLALFYVDNRTILMDLYIILFTSLALISRQRALQGVVTLLRRHNAPQDLIAIAMHTRSLKPVPPPGASEIVTKRMVSKSTLEC